MKKIAIIGAGPKAAALCAKAACVNLGGKQLELVVFERNRAGAAWTGQFGYTDGDQRLCTPVERDVGFPYGEGLLEADGVRELFARFSWSSFLVQGGSDEISYREWVDRGRKSPAHAVYADYVKWVIDNSGFRIRRGEVTALKRVERKWTVDYQRDGKTRQVPGFDGLVVTGPGPAITGFQRPSDPRITNGVAFWNDPMAFLAQTADREEAIVIAGSGGTSAAIAAWIARRLAKPRPILIIGNQAALYTRTESFFENALFSDEDAWAALKPSERVGVTRRLNRGVVWSSVSETLSASPNVRFRPGRVMAATITPPAAPDAQDELRLEVEDATGTVSDAASLIVDAAGFDSWWFVDLLPKSLRDRTLAQGALVSLAQQRDHLMSAMRDDLSIELGTARIHAPMLSLAQGPGFASLMVLGGMSERILRPYVDG